MVSLVIGETIFMHEIIDSFVALKRNEMLKEESNKRLENNLSQAMSKEVPLWFSCLPLHASSFFKL